LLSPRAVLSWWRGQRRPLQLFTLISAAGAVLGAVALVAVLIWSLSLPGRQADYRFEIYRGALALFQSKPLTGQGYFQFGRALLTVPGVQPDQPHNHAHNLVLHIAAEQGIGGLIALVISAMVILRQIRMNWRQLVGADRLHYITILMAFSVLIGHNMTDMLLTMPAQSIMALFILAAVLFVPASPIRAPATSRAYTWVMRILPLVLVLLALRDIANNQVYHDQIATVNADPQAYRSAADNLQAVIDSDPYMSIYQMQQAQMLGVAALRGDAEALPLAIQSYERVLALEPGYSMLWVNLAALYAQADNLPQAREAIQRAITLLPGRWTYYVDQARYATAQGDSTVADQALRTALEKAPDAVLDPLFQAYLPTPADPLFAELSPSAQAVLLVDSGAPEAALTYWQQTVATTASQDFALRAILYLAVGNRDAAAADLRVVEIRGDAPLWYHIGMARLVQFEGDAEALETHRTEAERLINPPDYEVDEVSMLQIAYLQFQRIALPRVYLPGVYAPIADPVARYLFERT
jgi:tetratricopeptide (TPR) repeat protein